MTPEPDRADAFVAGAPAAVGSAGAPALRLGAWEGPLDLLLDLARAQRVDLAQLSIATLAEQFAAAVDAAIARRQVPLSRLAEWHIMAAWLTLLRTRLLLPELPDDTAQAEAAGLRQRLADRDAARRGGWPTGWSGGRSSGGRSSRAASRSRQPTRRRRPT
jgi:segregation and condensation protein A